MADGLYFHPLVYPRVIPTGDGGTVRTFRLRLSTGAGFYDFTDDAVIYTLYADDATTVLKTMAATVSTTTVTAEYVIPAGVLPGQRMIEEWAPDNGQPPFRVDVYASLTSWAAPFSPDDVAARYPDLLATPAGGEASWWPLHFRIADEALARIITSAGGAGGDLLDPYRLRGWWFEHETAAFLRAVSGSSPSIVALAQDHEAKAAAEWALVTLTYDTDGDGDADTPATKPGPPTRRGSRI